MSTRHVLLAIAVALVWGINFVLIDVALGSFPPLLFAALRFTLVAFPAVLVVRRPRVPLRWVIGVGLFMSAGQFALLFVAIHRGVPPGLASVILPTQTVFTIALAIVFLGERPGRAQLAGAAVAVGGVVVIAAGRAHGVPFGALLLCIGAAASWGIGNICNRRAQAPDAIALLVWSSLVPPLPLFGLSLAVEGPHEIGHAFANLEPGGLLALLYVVIASTGFGFGTWTWLLRRHPASRVAPASLLVPPIGIAAAWIALGEPPGAGELAGAAIILCGLAVATSVLRLPRAAAVRRPAGILRARVVRSVDGD
ncbi:MAG TPA: EamA family transporter [Solirubrobacteraceae bacterium]|nr:EamA family transporter [Solirubrobacteraceae bacterium]